MTLTIALPPEDEKKLSDRAAAAGQDISAYVQDLVRREIDAPLSLLEACEPFARAVDASGVTEQEFMSILSRARDEVRAEKKKA